MVDVLTAMLAFLLGMLLFVGLAALAPAVPTDVQIRIGEHYYKQAMRGLGAAAIVYRSIGNPELKPINVDDETNTGEVTLTSGTISDDTTLPFKDTDNRIHRLYKKPLTIVPEIFPAATDAELAEIGHWKNEKEMDVGLERRGGFDPYVPVEPNLRVINPLDMIELAVKSIEPEQLKTAEDVTKARYSKYGGMPGLQESIGMTVAFAIGAGGAVGAIYVREEVLGGGSGGSPIGGGSVPIPPGMVDVALDALVVIA